MRKLSSWMIIMLLAVASPTSRAEGLLYQLPEDGSWARYEMQGTGIGADGQVRTTVAGTITLGSVGRMTSNGQDCRWLEIATTTTLGDQQFNEVYKLLIPEKRLKQGENPLDHVLKAWRKDARVSDGVPQQLDLAAVRSLDELLRGPAPDVTKLSAEPTESKLGKQPCEGFKGREVVKAGSVETEFSYEVRIHRDSPFGVVTFRYEKARQRDGQSLGARRGAFKLADFGTGAKSALPDNQ